MAILLETAAGLDPDRHVASLEISPESETRSDRDPPQGARPLYVTRAVVSPTCSVIEPPTSPAAGLPRRSSRWPKSRAPKNRIVAGMKSVDDGVELIVGVGDNTGPELAES